MKAIGAVQIDNERVIVTEWTFAPGAETGHHVHGHDYVVVPMTTGTLRLEDKGSEYLLHDDTYKILMHTFMSVDASREEKILQQLRRRMGFLKRILIDQIAAASRIFVFKDVLDSDHSRLRDLHSYEVPCIVILPITGGNPDFLAWIASETGEAPR